MPGGFNPEKKDPTYAELFDYIVLVPRVFLLIVRGMQG